MKSNKVIFLWLIAALCLVFAALFIPPLFAPGEQDVDIGQAASGKEGASAGNKSKEAGRACFTATKEKIKKTGVLFEGADVLLRKGDTYTLRVRVLHNDASDSFRRAIFTCEILDKGESWSIVRLEPAG